MLKVIYLLIALAWMMLYFADATLIKSFAIFAMMFILLIPVLLYGRVKGWV